MYERVDIEIRGICPLVIHNGQLADPLNEWSKRIKKITAKKKKTDEDYREVARLEFLGSFYVNDKKEPCIPGENIEAMLIRAARRLKLGEAAATIVCDGNIPIIYDGPRSPEKLWEIDAFRFTKCARIGAKRIMRTRPIIRDWILKFLAGFNTGHLNLSELGQILEVAAEMGCGDWRPKYGRFEIVSPKVFK